MVNLQPFRRLINWLHGPGHPNRLGVFWRLVETTPVVVPVALAAFGFVALLLAMLGLFRTELVWTLGGLATALTGAVVYKYWGSSGRPGGSSERRWIDLLVLAAVLAWVGFNINYTAQHVLTDRDPAVYSVTGGWLAQEGSLNVSIPMAFGDVEGVTGASSGFYDHKSGDRLYPHGSHLLPALLGASGQLVGNSRMLNLNVIFGGTALLAIYAFARQFMRPRWAATAAGVMAVSLPFLYFSRDMYTEPLMATFTFGFLALLWHAQKKINMPLWFLAGFLAGSAMLTRIDAYLTILALTLFVVILLALTVKANRKAALAQVAIFAAGALLPILLGLIDLRVFSALYYENHIPLVLQILKIAVLVAASGVVVIYAAWHSRLLKIADKATRKWRGPAIFVLILLMAVALASRPLWDVSYTANQIESMAAIQSNEGIPIEPRDYAEQAVYWLGWYIGPAAVLGFIGLALAAAQSATRRDLLLLSGVLTVAITSILYLTNPSITPDQIWAARRLLPVVFPGIVIFAAFALDYLFRRYADKFRFSSLLGLAVLAVLIIPPLMTSWPVMYHKEKEQLTSVKDMCDTLPRNAAVLWIGMARLEAVQPTRVFCQVPSMGYSLEAPSRDALVQVAAHARSQGYEPMVGVYGTQAGLISAENRPHMRTIELEYKELEQTLTRPPRKIVDVKETFFMGRILEDGSIRR